MRPRIAVGAMTSSTAGVGKKRHRRSPTRRGASGLSLARCGVRIEGGKSEGGTCRPVGAAVFSERRKQLWMDVLIAKLRCVLGSGRTEDHGAPAKDFLGYCDNNDDLRSFLLKQAIVRSLSDAYIGNSKATCGPSNGNVGATASHSVVKKKERELPNRYR